MCGRYSLTSDLDTVQMRFIFEAADLAYTPRYNIAPTQEVLTIVGGQGGNRAQPMRWGLIPPWTKGSSIGRGIINARAETVAERPSFREVFRRGRCLIVADGFYEWRRVGTARIPMRIILSSGEPFGFAGLWGMWISQEGESVTSCAIITTTPNEVMEPIHDRMPVILAKETEAQWLDPANTNTAELRELLLPYSAQEMEAYEVSPLVNSVKNDTPEVIEKVGQNGALQASFPW